jgi:hypothetical protein
VRVAQVLAGEGLAAADDGAGDDDDVNAVGGAPGGDESELEKLVARPLPSDVLLFAVPCCAPYAATKLWKYRVKVTPGSGKRGAAVKQCIAAFLKETPGAHAHRVHHASHVPCAQRRCASTSSSRRLTSTSSTPP